VRQEDAIDHAVTHHQKGLASVSIFQRVHRSQGTRLYLVQTVAARITVSLGIVLEGVIVLGPAPFDLRPAQAGPAADVGFHDAFLHRHWKSERLRDQLGGPPRSLQG
jgi:hypothetical protein